MSNERKKKLEEIAQILLVKNNCYNNNSITEKNLKKKEMKLLENNSKEKEDNDQTLIDKRYIKKIKNEKFLENKDIYTKYIQKKIDKEKNIDEKKQNDKLKLCTTINNSVTDYYYYCCKNNKKSRSSLLSEDKNENLNNNNNINNNSTININNNIDDKNNNINDIVNIDIDNNEDINDDDLFLIKFNTNNDSLFLEKDNNFNTFNNILQIYKAIMNNFNQDNLELLQYLSSEYISILLLNNDNDYEKINLDQIFIFFNYSIDIMKFIFYQISIFINILFLDNDKEFTESFLMSFKTILSYSSQNFEVIFYILQNPELYSDQSQKMTKSFCGRNKIIYSILKTIFPKKNSLHNSINNTQSVIINEDSINLFSYKYLDDIENETKINRNKNIQTNIYHIIDKLITKIKKSDILKEKISKIKLKQTSSLETILSNLKNNNSINQEFNNSNEKFFTLSGVPREGAKFSVFIELDETLVHYYEEGQNYFVKVRQGTDEFLKMLHEFCEIIIISTSSKEYTDIILENLNKENKYVDSAIYKEICDNNNEIIDFKNINRDIKKSIFICHSENDFFNVPESNVIELKEFLGEEDDKEIVILFNELKILNNEEIEDARDIIKDIINNIEKKRNEEKN